MLTIQISTAKEGCDSIILQSEIRCYILKYRFALHWVHRHLAIGAAESGVSLNRVVSVVAS